MHTILGLVLGFTVGVFAFANTIFPLLWAWPRARRMYAQARLERPISPFVFLFPCVSSMALMVAVVIGIEVYAPTLLSGVVIGLAIAFLGVMRKFMVRDGPDLLADFLSSYGKFFVTPSDEEQEGMGQVMSGRRKPTHREYLLLLDRCAVSAAIELPRAFRLSEQLPLSLRYRSFTLSVLWLLSIPAAFAASYWLRWWVGPVVLFTITPRLFRWGKAATAFDVINAMESNEQFYGFLVSRDLVTLQYREGSTPTAKAEA